MMEHIPFLGAGLGFRSELKSAIFRNRERIGFLEIISEHYLDAPKSALRELELLRKDFVLIPHGLELSIGTDEPLDVEYLRKLSRLYEIVQPPYWSEHLAMTRAGGIEIGHLAPLPRTREQIDVVVKKVRELKKCIGLPLILENIAYTVELPMHEMSEAEFVTRVVEEADCGLLLDVTNVFANATNHGYNQREFIDSLPLERMVQLHVVGGRWDGDVWVDSHSEATTPEIWELTRYVCDRAPVKGIIIERDVNFPQFGELRGELEMAVRIMRTARRIHGSAGASPSQKQQPTDREGEAPAEPSLTEMQTVLARLCTDIDFRQDYFQRNETVLPQKQIEYFARSLWSKRFGEAREILPLTCKALGKEARRLFFEHCQQYLPHGTKKHVDDALQFCKFLQHSKGTTLKTNSAVWQALGWESAMLSLRWKRTNADVRPRNGFAFRLTGSAVLLRLPFTERTISFGKPRRALQKTISGSFLSR